MTLLELSVSYAESAARIRARIVELRGQQHETSDPVEKRCLQRRINALMPLWQDMRELACLTAHYYDESEVLYEACQP